ncbi:MAG: hypothetical protein C4523_09415 [Myxococcales bacterium]|nr:MAG: hypothetical protein C4523_09415 [Myxococcales bacterium]
MLKRFEKVGLLAALFLFIGQSAYAQAGQIGGKFRLGLEADVLKYTYEAVSDGGSEAHNLSLINELPNLNLNFGYGFNNNFLFGFGMTLGYQKGWSSEILQTVDESLWDAVFRDENSQLVTFGFHLTADYVLSPGGARGIVRPFIGLGMSYSFNMIIPEEGPDLATHSIGPEARAGMLVFPIEVLSIDVTGRFGYRYGFVTVSDGPDPDGHTDHIELGISLGVSVWL